MKTKVKWEVLNTIIMIIILKENNNKNNNNIFNNKLSKTNGKKLKTKENKLNKKKKRHGFTWEEFTPTVNLWIFCAYSLYTVDWGSFLRGQAIITAR